MEYEHISIPADKVLIDPEGCKAPLCNDCHNPDCTNPIKEMTVSVFGINKKYRFWVDRNVVRQVVSCRGYIGDQHVVDAPSD